jgi:hypothetical protein
LPSVRAQLAFEWTLWGGEADVTAADCLVAFAATKPSVNADATRDLEL